MENKTKTVVRICGSDYTLVGTESEQYIQKVCRYVDNKMRAISSSTHLNKMKAAVLTAINLSDEYHKAIRQQEQISAELEKYKVENAALKTESENLKMRLSRAEGRK